MVPDWETNTVLISDVLPTQHPEIVRRLETILQEHGISLATVPGTSDIWIRDAAPVQVNEQDFVQFIYLPDYLQNGHEHLITGPESFCNLPFIKRLETSELVIDGGNIVGCAGAAILTEKMFRENPERNEHEIEDELRRLLRVEHLIVIPREPYDQIGHSDGMVRFITETTVIVNDYAATNPKFGDKLSTALRRRGLKIELLPYKPEGRKYDGIESAVGNYANFLRVGNLIVMPSYGKSTDTVATAQLQRLCPEATVTSVPCRKLARKGGVLQCVTWTVQVVESRLCG
jgi:agmatine deiminase